MEQTNPRIEESWLKLLLPQFQSPYFAELKQFLKKEMTEATIYPPGSKIFSAFDATPFNQVKVVILGQDPYHGPGQAHGMCFSVLPGIKPPPSLVNIFKEIHSDLGIPVPNHGNLEKWAAQGVLLLNSTLTVRAATPKSHFGKGWERFTDFIIFLLSELREGIVFLLWGNDAKQKQSLIDPKKHHILTAPHPSPLSAYHGFLGCRHFSKTNEILVQQNMEPIDWNI